MNVKRGVIICGIAAIPLWYAYRSVGQHRAISVDEIFEDEATILRHELEETKRQAEKDLEDARAQNTPEARKRKVAADMKVCVQFAAEVQERYDALVRDQSAWRREVQELKGSKAGAAIATNEDYVRVFRSFEKGFTTPDYQLQWWAKRIKESAQVCLQDGKVNPSDWFYGETATGRLTELEKEITEAGEDFSKVQSNVRWLARVATGEGINALDAAAGKQRVRELSELEKAKEERAVQNAR